MKSKQKISRILLWGISVGIGVPLGYYVIPDKMSVWQGIWYPLIIPFFVCFALMFIKGIWEEYFQ